MLHPEWSPYLRILLAVHILGGAVAFVCAPVALVTAKGGRTHRQWGRVYFWAMAVVAATALVLSVALPIVFLGLVAVFSFYSAFAAYRVLYLKDLYAAAKARALDWAAAALTFVCSLALALAGIVFPAAMGVGVIRVAGHALSIVAIVFGGIGMWTAYRATRPFVHKPADKMFWWYEHLQGMIASYIAALTAFSAVNLTHAFGAAWWVWLWPTIIGAPAIAIWTTYYKRKFVRRAKPTIRPAHA